MTVWLTGKTYKTPIRKKLKKSPNEKNPFAKKPVSQTASP